MLDHLGRYSVLGTQSMYCVISHQARLDPLLLVLMPSCLHQSVSPSLRVCVSLPTTASQTTIVNTFDQAPAQQDHANTPTAVPKETGQGKHSVSQPNGSRGTADPRWRKQGTSSRTSAGQRIFSGELVASGNEPQRLRWQTNSATSAGILKWLINRKIGPGSGSGSGHSATLWFQGPST